MSQQSQLLLYFISLVFCSVINPKMHNPLNRKHLRVLAYEFGKTLILKRNATNHIVGLDGVLSHQMEALAEMLKFSYSIVPGIAIPMEDRPSVRGAISYIVNGDADYLLAAVLPTSARLKLLDFPSSWYEGPYHCMVPYPIKKLNTTAIVQPLALEVWVLIIVAAITVTLCLRLLVNKRCQLWQSTNSLNPVPITKNVGREINNFVWGNLISQGHSFDSSRLVICFVTGAWCLGCFFLIQSYCSTLTSHLMSPNQKPIADSVEEMAHSPHVGITVDQELGLKNILLSAESGNIKLLGEKLRRNSNLICNSTSKCLATVKDGNAAYCNTLVLLNAVMATDFKNEGTCHYYLINDILLSTFACTALTKNSPYTEIISKGILRFKEAGLTTQWLSLHTSSAWQCKLNLKRQDKNLQKLSIRHLVSAFVILFCGIVLSTVAFALEKMTWILCKRS